MDNARAALAAESADIPFAFAATRPMAEQDFDFLFGHLQEDEANLLPQSSTTRDNLVRLGQSMVDTGDSGEGDSAIPAAYTYFGQFVDHDITLEEGSASADVLVAPGLVPLSREEVCLVKNLRTATLDLDNVYGVPAPRDPNNPDQMLVGLVTSLGQPNPPLSRPANKTDDNDVPRGPRNQDPTQDRVALIGDPRDDENTIISQMQVAFLKAHNRLVQEGHTFASAQTTLRQHYQHIVIHDFLKRIVDPQIVDDILANDNQFYDALAEPFFLPFEFSFAAYRFGHTLVRAQYDFNVNFNRSGNPGTLPASLGLLFTFTALSGDLGDNDTLPDNWIIEWHNFVDVGQPFNKARRFDTQLVEPLLELRDVLGVPEMGLKAHLAVRNLLRGYLMRLPTGQAVANAMGKTPLTPAEVESAAINAEQAQVLKDSGFSERTPLWFYILAEAALEGGNHLGPVGGTLVAEVLIGLARRSQDSILRTPYWNPSLPSEHSDVFTLADLLKYAQVL